MFAKQLMQWQEERGVRVPRVPMCANVGCSPLHSVTDCHTRWLADAQAHAGRGG